jgi:outer membrane protein TolC
MKLITLQIDSTYDQLERLKQKIKTSDTAVKLATQRLNQEQKLVSEGKGNIYKLVEQQELMTRTKIKAVEAQAMLNKSIISLWISSGEIFEKLDVDKNLIQ